MSKARPNLDPAIETKLIKAITNRDAAEVERLVATGIDVNAPLQAERGETPLAVATRYGCNEVVVALFKAGADWRKGGLDLIWPVYFRDEWLTRQLIEAGADVNFKARIMGRPLPLATGYNLPNLMRLLIDAGADVNADSPITGAVSANHTEAALLLLKAGAAVPKDQQLLPWAAQRSNREVLLALIEAGADLNEHATLTEYVAKRDRHVTYCEHATPLIIAAANGAEALVQDLIAAGADLHATDATGATALEAARKNHHAEAAARLEASMAKQPRPADPSADLVFAAEKGDAALVKKLLAAGAEANIRDLRPKSKGFTPLMLAARAGHREATAALLDGGADLALKDDADLDDAGFGFIFNEGGLEGVVEAGYSMARTALHWAVEKGHAEVARLLLERGADANCADRAKLAPLHIAAEAGAAGLVRELLQAGADPGARARAKETPLHCACRGGHIEIVQALLAAGAPPDLKNDEGNTPLIVAAGNARARVVALLLEAGADVRAVNRARENALTKAAGPQLYEQRYDKKEVVVRFLRPESEMLETIRLLVAAGADPALKSKEDFSALDWARRGLKDSKFYAGVIEVLQQAQRGAAATESSASSSSRTKPPRSASASRTTGAQQTPPAKATRPAKSEAVTGAEPAPRPDFTAAAARPEFQAALRDLEKRCSTKPQPLHAVAGGFTFHVQTGQPFDLDAVHREFLERGCHVFSLDATFANQIGVLPTADKYEVLLAMQTNGQNFDLLPQDVVAWLRKLEQEQPFLLTGAGFDFLSGKFTTKIARPAALAKRMYEFCPDIVDQGCGDIKALAAELRQSQALFFWWD